MIFFSSRIPDLGVKIALDPDPQHCHAVMRQMDPDPLIQGHPALQNIFNLLDPDPDSEYGSGSTDLIESGSITDPNPKPWFKG
jgi:hypothetical protein